jgi:hypothetical protein
VALKSLFLFAQAACGAGQICKVRLDSINIIVTALFQFHDWGAQNVIVSLFDENDQSPANTEGV